MESKNKFCARKATWLAFGLVALATSISSAQDAASLNSNLDTTYVSWNCVMVHAIVMVSLRPQWMQRRLGCNLRRMSVLRLSQSHLR